MQQLDSFPTPITRGDILTYFTLSSADRRRIPRTTSAANRLGFALQLGALRYPGFSPDDPSTVPEAVVAFVPKPLDVAPTTATVWATRPDRTEHPQHQGRWPRAGQFSYDGHNLGQEVNRELPDGIFHLDVPTSATVTATADRTNADHQTSDTLRRGQHEIRPGCASVDLPFLLRAQIRCVD